MGQDWRSPGETWIRINQYSGTSGWEQIKLRPIQVSLKWSRHLANEIFFSYLLLLKPHLLFLSRNESKDTQLLPHSPVPMTTISAHLPLHPPPEANV